MVALSRIAISQSVGQQNRLTRTIADLETAIATGKRYARPSDGPRGWTQLSEVARQRADIAAAREPVASGATRARAADRWLGELADSFARAREIVVAGGGTPGAGRSVMVAELTAMRTNLPARFAETSATGQLVVDSTAPLAIGLGDGRTTVAVPRAADIDQVAGQGSLADILDGAIAAVSSGDPAQTASTLTALDAAIAHIATQQAEQGFRMQHLEAAEGRLVATDLDLLERQSSLGDTNIAEAISAIQSLAVQRDASRAILSRTAGQTLFDYLR